MCCCAIECVKCLLLFFDVIFFLTGVALLGVGIHVLVGVVNGTYASLIAGVSYIYITYAILVIAFIIIIVSLIGCCAGVLENKCLLVTFYFFVVFCICLEVSVAIIAFVGLWYEDDFVEAYIIQASRTEMANYGHKDKAGFSNSWDRLQTDEQCCGVLASTDWHEYGNFDAADTPDSCCKEIREGCGLTIGEPWEKSCGTVLIDNVNNGLYLIGAICIGCILLQILLIIFILAMYYILKFGSGKNRCCGTYYYDMD
ncbi:tetraspanin-4-like [Acanthaster planci]|uniref:Tetraspanin n=1 Tax=Acanthaster planci TaxID=133434 RepID=A0A8B7XSB7_ACAPL|nr:tetraspanin-4-like [Acanthaster planci]XP_022083754.1 tetraspanin-4-like [Acanthaster planci]